MLPEHPPETVELRVAITVPNSLNILALEDHGSLGLPMLRIPGRARPAEAITAAIADRWGIFTSLLAFIPNPAEGPRCAVLELIGNDGKIPASLVPTSPIALDSNIAPEERVYLERLLSGVSVDGDPLFKRGWLKQVKTAIEERLPSTFTGFSNEVQQLNLSGPFTLVRLGTNDGSAYWFKRVGSPNLHEFEITVELAKRFPAYIPEVVCEFPQWNAWVTKEVSGQHLSATSDANDAVNALKALARLQQDSVPLLDGLRSHGARDATLRTVQTLCGDFLAEMPTAMAEQISTKSRALGPDEIDKLCFDLTKVIEEAIQIGVPNTLVHLDIGHGNVLASPSGPVFLDWAETFIGLPFVTAEHLVTDLESAGAYSPVQLANLRHDYAEQWYDYAPKARLGRLLQLAPTLAVTTYAVIGWNERRKHSSSKTVWPFLRSLTRRMQAEIKRLPECVA